MGCWDTCGKSFDDGRSVHDHSGSQVRSLQVTGPLRVTVAGGSCHGTFNYGTKDLKRWPSFTELDGCVNLVSDGNAPAHFVVEELNKVAEELNKVEPNTNSCSVFDVDSGDVHDFDLTDEEADETHLDADSQS